NRSKLVEQQTRYRLQLTAIEDVLFPELKEFFEASITGPAVRSLLEAFGTPQQVAAALPDDLYEAVVRRGRARRHAGRMAELQMHRQLRKLPGWYPEAKESGTSVSKHRLGQSGNRLARREIWLWVMFLISPRAPATPFRDYYERLRSRGVAGRTAIGHVAGKLISVLFHCVSSGQLYDSGRNARELGRVDVTPALEDFNLISMSCSGIY